MVELVIASNNTVKIREIRAIVGDDISLLSLMDIGFMDNILEPFNTFEENAAAKARVIYSFCHKNVFADDSGLCVNALHSAPGVNSAHYSGERDDEKNLQKVLSRLEGKLDRSAYYRAVICLVWNGVSHYFDGVCEGNIAQEKRGDRGFGYDPIFIPEGFDKTFGELSLDVKNEISHRGKAMKKMVAFLKQELVK